MTTSDAPPFDSLENDDGSLESRDDADNVILEARVASVRITVLLVTFRYSSHLLYRVFTIATWNVGIYSFRMNHLVQPITHVMKIAWAKLIQHHPQRRRYAGQRERWKDKEVGKLRDLLVDLENRFPSVSKILRWRNAARYCFFFLQLKKNPSEAIF
jgi:hypothetical protein